MEETCRTCQWAVTPLEHAPRSRFPLVCSKIDHNNALAQIVNEDQGYAELHVSPDFSCSMHMIRDKEPMASRPPVLTEEQWAAVDGNGLAEFDSFTCQQIREHPEWAIAMANDALHPLELIKITHAEIDVIGKALDRDNTSADFTEELRRYLRPRA